MAKPYSSNLRERVIEAIEAGHTQSEAAVMLNLCLRSVNNDVKRWRTTGKVKSDKFGGHKTYKLAAHADKVKALVKAEPDQTAAELQAKLEEAKIKASTSGRSAVFCKSRRSLIKNSFCHRAKAC